MKFFLIILFLFQILYAKNLEIKYSVFQKKGTEYIQNSLDSAANYEAVIFEKGVYNLDTTVFLSSNSKLVLSSKTILKQKKSIPLFYIKNADNVSISGGCIEGYKGVFYKPRNKGYQPRHVGILIESSSNVKVKDCTLKLFCSDAIVVVDSKTIWVDGNYFVNNLDNPVSVAFNSKDVFILNNKMYDNDGDGILIKGGSVIVKNNIISSVGKYNFGGHGASGIALGTDNNINKFGKIVISDNIIKNVTGFGIVNDGIKDVIISNNIISHVDKYYAIKIGNFRSSGNIISNNVISDCKNGIKVDNNAVLIANNIIDSKPKISGNPLSKFIFNNIHK